MRIGSVDLDERVLVVAEVGNNHEGDLDLAKQLVRLAADAGADAIKFQTIVPEKLVAPHETERLEQLRRFQLSKDDFRALRAAADDAGIVFLSTPFDLGSLRFLDELVPAVKIASGDNDFFPLIEAAARTGKPILLSTGLADLDLIARDVDLIRGVWREIGADPDQLVVLQCAVSYPTPYEEANLLAIRELAELHVTVGLSDHTLGVDAAPIAVGLGARVIEKHFTIAKDHSDFRDHAVSADPPELAELVRRVREASVLLGDGVKRVQPTEAAAAGAVRRSIVAARGMQAGTVVTMEDLDWVRMGGGLSVGREDDIVGKLLARDVLAGEGLDEAAVGEV